MHCLLLKFVFVVVVLAPSLSWAEKPVSRIALGSCATQEKPQPIWFSIVDYQPQLFLFLGDNIYGDTEDMDVLKAKYEKLGAKPGYQKLRENCTLLATWDDHDYGVNDGGAEYPKRAESQQVFNDFFNVPADSPRRKRPGIYDAATFGPEGKRVQVILLDTRYFRSRPQRWPAGEKPRGEGPYVPSDDPVATVLGEAQWNWLKEQLKQPADLRIIATSFQFVPDGHHWESWRLFPEERQRMLDLIAETEAEGVIFVSGDRHHGEISKLAAEKSPAGYPLYELTSSSLNRPGGGNEDEPNRHRLSQVYSPINFGTITIDWEAAGTPIMLALHDGKGEVVYETKLTLRELQSE